MALFSLLSLARDGVLANAGALNVTGQNIAGASTPGFVRRSPEMTSRPTGGVEMTSIKRGFDRFSYDQLITQEARLASASARGGALVTVEASIAPSTNNLGERASALFSAMHEMALSPSDLGVRNAVLARADWLARGFNETSDGLNALRQDLFVQSRDVVAGVNDRLKRIAQVEQQLVESEARGEPTADMRDTRDQLVREVADSVGARAVESQDGRLTLFAGGVVLVEGGQAAQLDVSLDGQGALKIQVDRKGSLSDITSQVQSGKLAGIAQVRDKDIPTTLAGLDAFAKDTADMLNAIHVTGYGLDGANGRPLFEPLTGTAGAAHALKLDPLLDGHPERLGAASSPGELPGGNTVAAKLAAANVAKLGPGDTVSERYASITSRVGVARSSAIAEETMRQDTVAAAQSLRESASGVSADEEMVKLQQFQRAFEASTRVLRTIDSLFDSLLAVVG
jgi:flagellar hook-associated protein 1 FlgK